MTATIGTRIAAGLIAATLLAACGDGGASADREGAGAAVACGTPELAVTSAAPLEWIEVTGLPEGFGPAIAEVTAAGSDAELLAPVLTGAGGRAEVRVPVHPSFRIEGGAVELRLVSEATECAPVPLTIAALEPAPGTMAEAAGELRAALDELARPAGADRLSEELLTSGRPVPLLAIGALWALPELETLERLTAEDAVAAESPEDAAMLDALAAHLALPERMARFRALIAGTRALTGELWIAPPGDGLAAGDRPSSAFQFASYGPRAPGPRPATRLARPGAIISSLECPTDRGNLFDIAEPEKLDNLMRAQDYAERFMAGASDEEGGSAAGTVFGDIGTVMGLVGMAGKQGKAIAAVWESFSTVVLNTQEAYEGLLPGDMELVAVASPEEFNEDSEETGRWTAQAKATSKGMKLTEKVIEKVMEAALEKGLGDASLGKPLKRQVGASIPDEVLDETSGRAAIYWNEVGDKVAEEVDDRAEKAVSGAMKSFLDAVGADEGPDGFDIPGGCWEMADMSASDDGVASNGGPPPPPLVKGYLTGDAVEFVQDGSEAPREYEPVQPGTSRLEIRTAEGYRKSMELPGIDELGVSYAFGGDQYVAATDIEVHAIQVEIHPTVAYVEEPGEPVPFVATVTHADDTGVEWSSDIGVFEDQQSWVDPEGDGVHEATLSAPWATKEMYPIEVEVESTSRGGARLGRRSPRKATARVRLGKPEVTVSPPVACVSPGEEREFDATIAGEPAASFAWDVRAGSDGGDGRIDDDGRFRAETEGMARVYATWRDDPEVRGFAAIEVSSCDNRWLVSIGGGPGGGSHSGENGYISISTRSGQDGNRQIVAGQVMSIGLKTEPNPRAGGNPIPGSCPFVLLQPREDGVLPSAGSFMAKGSVTFGDCSGDFGNVLEGSGYELMNGAGVPQAPGAVMVSLDDVTDEQIRGTFTGTFYQQRHQAENGYIEYETQFPVSGSFSLPVQDWP